MDHEKHMMSKMNLKDYRKKRKGLISSAKPIKMKAKKYMKQEEGY